MEIVEMKCNNCGGTLKFEANKEVISCPFCGSEKIFFESDELKVARINAEIENKKLEYQIEKDEKDRVIESVQQFKKGKLSKVIIVCAVVALMFGIGGLNNSFEYWISSIIALFQCGLFIISWLMGNGIITKGRDRYGIIMLVAFLMIIPFLFFVP